MSFAAKQYKKGCWINTLPSHFGKVWSDIKKKQQQKKNRNKSWVRKAVVQKSKIPILSILGHVLKRQTVHQPFIMQQLHPLSLQMWLRWLAEALQGPCQRPGTWGTWLLAPDELLVWVFHTLLLICWDLRTVKPTKKRKYIQRAAAERRKMPCGCQGLEKNSCTQQKVGNWGHTFDGLMWCDGTPSLSH